MTFDNWHTVAALFFFVGMGAGLLLAGALCNAFWKISAIYCSAQAAARIAEKSLLEAEIRVEERRLAEARQRFSGMIAAVVDAEKQRKAVTQ